MCDGSQPQAFKVELITTMLSFWQQSTCGLFTKIISTFSTSKPPTAGRQWVQTRKVSIVIRLYYLSLLLWSITFVREDLLISFLFLSHRYLKYRKRCLNDRKKLGSGCSEVNHAFTLVSYER